MQQIWRGHKMVRENAFFAMIDRTKYIQRWSLMRNTQEENLAEHSYMVAVLAHALAVIRLVYRADATPEVSPEKVLAYAMYHDIAEVITGDLPTPVKYKDKSLELAYKQIELHAQEDMLQSLPEAMRRYYAAYVLEKAEDEEEKLIKHLVKGADKLSAYIKCLSEVEQGNKEFQMALEATRKRLQDLNLTEVDIFIEKFIPSFALSLDALRENNVEK